MDLPEEQVAALDQLMVDTRLRTRKELFNNALTLFEWAVKQKKAGRVIAAIDQSQDIVKELVMPSLENAGPTLGDAPHEVTASAVSTSGR